MLAASRELDPERPVIVMTAYSAIDTRGRVDPPGRVPLPDQAVQAGRARDLPRPRARRACSVRREAAALQDRAAGALLDREHHRPQRGDAGACASASSASPTPPAPVHRARRDRHRQGPGRARAPRRQPARRARRSSSVNCAALPEPLLESELFGHVKGAFTGAIADRPGLFAEADGGTLFLDEIGEMTPALQAKLLHVLESGARAPGRRRARSARSTCASSPRPIATWRRRVRDGTFREDLLYRLDVVSLDGAAAARSPRGHPASSSSTSSPTRARVPAVAACGGFSADGARACCERYRWPGNVRELAHVVEKLVLLGRRREVARRRGLPEPVRERRAADADSRSRATSSRCASSSAGTRPGRSAQTGGHRGKAAEKLGDRSEDAAQVAGRRPRRGLAPGPAKDQSGRNGTGVSATGESERDALVGRVASPWCIRTPPGC